MFVADEVARNVLTRKEQRAWKDVPETTRRWCRNPIDVIAAADGCRFNVLQGGYVVWWIERYCRLYEGEWAGEPVLLRGEHRPPPWLWKSEQHEIFWPPADSSTPTPAMREAKRRAGVYDRWHKADKPVDWQYECIMRLFGWLRFSERWGRWIRRFNDASIWVPKKNKKSPTLAALALYLTAGDEEPGQKVFVAAKDGQQAREIVGQHAVEMLRQSPELSRVCFLNRSTFQISHDPTRSYLRPLSSGNISTREAKEGLNGSLVVDETHVVDRSFMEVVGRTGISRAEPLKIEVSTAGNNPDSYGKERHDYGALVNRADVRDLHLFYAAYEVPQTLKPEEFARDPVGYGRLANPAWGHTIATDEYLQDFERSKITPYKFASFLMYRCNLWQRAASPWLRYSDWEACRCEETIEDFLGASCVVSIDKSKTQDMSAVVATFSRGSSLHDWEVGTEDTLICTFCGEHAPRDDAPASGCLESFEYFQYPFFFLPRVTAEDHAKDADFLGWNERGFLTLIPGEVIQDGYLKACIRDLDRRFTIEGVYYDRTYCEDLTQWCVEELGVDRVQMQQTASILSEPITTFERMVIQRLIHHGANPVMDWQIGHCAVIEMANGRRMLAKPKRGDVRKIDGPVASVMGLAGARDVLKGSLGSGAWTGKGMGMFD